MSALLTDVRGDWAEFWQWFQLKRLAEGKHLQPGMRQFASIAGELGKE